LPDTTGGGVPMHLLAGAGVEGRTRAEGWEYLPAVNFYGPLMDHVNIRSDEDAKLIGKEIARRITEAVDQAKRRGRVRQPGG
jgi:hypothetical protein